MPVLTDLILFWQVCQNYLMHLYKLVNVSKDVNDVKLFPKLIRNEKIYYNYLFMEATLILRKPVDGFL